MISWDMGQHDVFICFSSKDEEIARRVVQFLEARAVRCWISARDVEPGQNYQESIVHALEAARIIVFLFSEHSNQSGEIKKELSLGASSKIAVIPLRLSNINPSGALRYELATTQWVDFFPDRELALGRLSERINSILRGPAGVEESVEPIQALPRKAAAPIVAAGSEEFEAVRSLLARHVGPIAKIFVQKAAADAPSLDDFCQRLAAHVPTPAERATFLQAARARLAVKP
jgi:hypothetical protein